MMLKAAQKLNKRNVKNLDKIKSCYAYVQIRANDPRFYSEPRSGASNK